MQGIMNRLVGMLVLGAMVTCAAVQPAFAQRQRAGSAGSRALNEFEYTSISTIDHTVEDQHLERLRKLIDCSFVETPLIEVIDFIKAQTSVPLTFDSRVLDEASVGVDSAVTFNAERISARNALHLILGRMDLTLLGKSGVILITTVDKANSELETRVYPVADLVRVVVDGRESQDFDGLIEVITTTADPTTWDEVGGPGAIHEFHPKSALVISQTAFVHEEVAGLIELLRRLPSTYSSEVRSGIRRLPPPRSFGSSASATLDRWPTPTVNVQRVVNARAHGGGFFSVDPAPAHDSKPRPAQLELQSTNAAPQNWRIPRSHRD